MARVLPDTQFRTWRAAFLPSLSDPESLVPANVSDRSDPKIVFKPFEPAVYHEAALITPAHRPASRLAKEFTGIVRSRLTELQDKAAD